MTREEQKEKRRWDILQAGLEIFIKRGYVGTKISDIAKEAKMSVGLLFHYFENKEALFETLIEYGLSGPKSMEQLGALPPLIFFTESAKQIFESLKTEPITGKMFVLMTQSMYNDAIPDSCKDKLREMVIMQWSAVKVKEGQDQGVFKGGDPLALSIAFWASLTGIIQQVALDPSLPVPQGEWLVDILKK